MAEFDNQKPSTIEREEEEGGGEVEENVHDEEAVEGEEEEDEKSEPPVTYPIKVIYCGVCGLPPEYCCFGETKKECKEWAEANCPEELELSQKVAKMSVSGEGAAKGATGNGEGGGGGGGGEEGEGEGEEGDDKKKTKKKTKKPKKPADGEGKPNDTKVWIARVNRNKRKFVTVVGGMESVPDVKLKDAAKAMGRHFACGASVNKHVVAGGGSAEEIIVQGDVVMDLPDWLEATYGIPADKIFLQS